MIPYPEVTDVGGVPLTQILSKEEIEDVVEKTKNGGAEIVKHLKTSAFYAPGRAISAMVESILSDEDKVIASCAVLDGEYGYSGVAIGVPCVLGASGIKKIIELDLDESTKEKFDVAVKSIKSNIAILKDGGFFDKVS
jgi:malate dehydrogenase